MKRNACLIYFLLISCSCISQKLPSYKATVYDSSVTGYYFLANGECLMILDKSGNLVYYKAGNQLSNFMLQPNGMMSYYAYGKFFLMDSSFKVVDSVACKSVPVTNNHDLRILPDGHFLMLGTDSARMDLSHFPYWKQRSSVDTANVKYTVVQEQDAKKNVVFEWRAPGHHAIEDVDTFFLPLFPLFDWTHPDAVEMDHDGNILVSNRNLNEITKINRSNGSVMWRLGGKHNEFKFINCSVPFYGQSDIRRIANGHITLFDNGVHNISHGARALEFELDEVNKIATLKWSYTYPGEVVSNGQGNVQRLDNSNTLVCFGRVSDDLCFVVVDSSGSKTFQMDGIRTNRAFNYPVLPFQLHRPEITCFDSLGIVYLKTTESYASYQWSDAETTRIIQITQPGIYSVFVPYGQGGFISSEKMIVNDVLYFRILKSPFGKDEKSGKTKAKK